MKLSKLLITGIFAAAALTGCTFVGSEDIVKVNDGTIKRAAYEEIYKNEIEAPQYKQFEDVIKDKDSIMGLMLKDRITNEMILKEILRQETEKRNITVTPEEIAARKAEIEKQLDGAEKVEDLLKKSGISEKQYEEDIESELKINKLIEATKSTKVTDADAKKFYQENKASFNYPERVRASHILVAVNPAQIKQEIISEDKKGNLTSEEINKKLDEIVANKLNFAKELRAKAASDPKNFAALAKQYSEDKVSAQQGGDLGFFSKDSMVKPFADVAFKLKPGVVSEVVETDYGYHIILVTDKAAAGIQPYEKIKDELKAYMEQKNKIDVLENLMTGLRESAKIEYLDESFNPENIQKQIREISKKEAEKAEKESQKAANKTK